MTWDLVGRVVVGSRIARTKTMQAKVARFARDRMCELGPSLVKIGQAVATREDVVGEEAARVLAGLYDAVPPMTREEAWQVLEEEGFSPEGLCLSDQPAKAASIAQVYKGVVDGVPVAVKVQRPGVREVIAEDLVEIKAAVGFMRAIGFPVGDAEVLDRMGELLVAETDFRAERENAKALRSVSEGEFHVPRVHRSSTARVLIMEWSETRPLRTREHSRMLLSAFTNQMARGVVHGDPHPGNVGIGSSGELVMYDCGSVARIPDQLIESVPGMLTKLAEADFDGFAKDLVANGVLKRGADAGHVADLVRYLVSQQSMDPDALRDMGRNPPFALTDDMAVLFRAMALIDGTCRSMDPDVDYTEFAKEFSPSSVDVDWIPLFATLPTRVASSGQVIERVRTQQHAIITRQKSIEALLRVLVGLMLLNTFS